VQRSAQGFEHGFEFMVVVAAVTDMGVDVGAQFLAESDQKIQRQGRRKSAEETFPQIALKEAIGPAAKVDGHLGQRFIHWHQKISGPDDTGFIAQGLSKSLPQNQSAVFDQVVSFDAQITPGLDVEVEQAMAAERIEHVAKEIYLAINMTLTAAVNVEGYGYLRFPGFTFYTCLSH
jgi:hypothetical protein